jgi:hypothetical protein
MNGFEKVDRIVEISKLKQERHIILQVLDVGYSEAVVLSQKTVEDLKMAVEEIDREIREMQQ